MPSVTEEAVLRWAEAVDTAGGSSPPRTVTVPVRYDGEDLLAEVAARTGLSVDGGRAAAQLDPLTTSTRWVLRPVSRLWPRSTNRYACPAAPHPAPPSPPTAWRWRTNKPAFIRFSTPGGWHLLGTTLESLYDPHRRDPFLLQPGDSVKFEPAQGDTPPEPKRLELLAG